MEDHLTKVNNKKIIFPESVRTVVDDLGAMGEKQKLSYQTDWLWVRYQFHKELIWAKAFATHIGSLTNFGEFAVLVYYEVMKHAWNYDRIDLVFDRYFEKSIKEGTRSGRGEGSQHLFEGSSTEIPYKMAESFLKKQPKQ